MKTARKKRNIILYKTMQEGNSTNMIIQPNIPPQNHHAAQFCIIEYDGNSYRVNAQQYILASIGMNFTWGLWVSLSLVYIALIVENFVHTHAIIAMGSGVGASLILTGIVIRFRDKLIPLIWLSFINLDCYMIACLILVILEQKSMIIPTIPFSIIQFIILIVFLENKLKILIFIPIAAQLYLMILTVDETIQIELPTVFFIIMLLVICCFVISIVGFLYVGIMVLITERISMLRVFSLLLIFFIFLSIAFGLGILPLYVVFGLQIWIGAIIALAFSFLTAIFIFCHSEKGKIFLCDYEIIKGDSISIQKKEVTVENFSYFRLMKVSENWFKKVHVSEIQKYESQAKEDEIQSINECLVCLERVPSGVWIPCGHLTTCENCCEYLLKKNNIACVLCKKIPKEIYFMRTERNQQNCIDEHMEEKDKKMKKSELFHEIKKVYQIQIL